MVAELAAAKGFTEEQLASFGVRQGVRGVEIPYFDTQGAETPRVRYRTAISARDGSSWSEGKDDLVPYGLQRPVPWEKQYAFIVEGECLTGDAEALTPDGWTRLDELADGTQVAQWNEGVSTFVTPLHVTRRAYTGDIVTFDSKQLFQRVTPKHKMVIDYANGNRVIKQAQDVTCGSVPRTSTMDGDGLALSNDEIALALAVSADAKIDQRVETGPYVYFSLKKKRKLCRLNDLLERLGLAFEVWPDQHREDFFVVRVLLPLKYSWIGRLLPWSFVANATLEQRRYMLEEMVHWDGNHVVNRNQVEYSTIHQQNAEIIQALAHTSGFRSTIMHRSNELGEWIKVSVLLTEPAPPAQIARRHKTVAPYEGQIYCVTVPSGFFLVRQNGIVSVTGNTDCWALWTAGKPALGIPGASNAKCLLPEHVAGATSLYVIREPGVAGARFPHRVADRLYSQGFEGTVFAIDLEKAKDPHELWLRDPQNFEAEMRAAMGNREQLKRAIVDKTDTGVRSLASILAKPRRKVQYLVEGLLPDGGIMLVAAKPKAGKSELIRNLARSVALGTPFLGREVRQGNVVWVRLEEPFEHFVDNIMAMGGEEFVHQLFVNESSPPADTIKWLESVVSEFRPILIVIDTWAKLTRIDDINSYSKVNLANEALMRISRDRGIAQVWIHHSNKGDGKGGAAVLGSSALFAACDTLMTIERYPNDTRTMSTTQRVGEDMPETQIIMDPETKLITIASGRSGIRNGQMERDLLDIISSEPQILKTDLLERVQARKSDILAALATLEERGIIINESAGIKGSPHRYSVVIRNSRNVVKVNFGNRNDSAGTETNHPGTETPPSGTESAWSGTENAPSGTETENRELRTLSVPEPIENEGGFPRDRIPFRATTPPYGGECGGDTGTENLLSRVLTRDTQPEPVRTHDGIKLGTIGSSPILVSPTQSATSAVCRQSSDIANGGRA